MHSLPPGIHERAAPLLAAAFSHTFWVSLVLTALAYTPALFLPRGAPAREHEPLAVEA